MTEIKNQKQVGSRSLLFKPVQSVFAIVSFLTLLLTLSTLTKAQIEQAQTAQAKTSPLAAGTTKHCQFNPEQGPEMVILSGGHFLMGSGDDDKYAQNIEKPRHWVAIQPFALSRCEITVAYFKHFVQETGYATTAEQSKFKGCTGHSDSSINISWRDPDFIQDEQHPVTCVSWHDATAFISWLSERTGEPYRLPTEAEWEYAARGGTRTRFSTGECLNSKQANIRDGVTVFKNCISHGGYLKKTTRVGSYPSNAFGLYDMHGNLWEWTTDCYHRGYLSSPIDGSAWFGLDVNCLRVLRGGSWYYEQLFARSAFRFRLSANDSFFFVGFRVARTL